jgi:hypothetical protein
MRATYYAHLVLLEFIILIFVETVQIMNLL